MHTVYFLHTYDGSVFYVGFTQQSLQARLAQHLAEARRKPTSKYYQRTCKINKIRKLVENQQKIFIVPILTNLLWKEAKEYEMKYIAWCKRIGILLTNATLGGEGSCRVWTQEQKEKARLSNLGSKNPSFGKSPSEETRTKQRLALKGKPNPAFQDPVKKAIWRQKITANHADVSGQKNPMFGKSGVLSPRGKTVQQWSIDKIHFLDEFGSTREASRITGIPASSISFCAAGIKKSAGEFYWKYI